MNLANKTVFLTGVRGMVGRNLVDKAPPAIRIVAPTRRTLDLEDSAAVEREVRNAKPDLIIHAAGRVGGIQANIAEPAAFLADNIRIGLNVLQAGDRLGVPVLNIASSCIYPPEAPNPLTESMLLTGSLEPTNEGYALAKLAVLRYGQYCNTQSTTARIKSVIPCNLYGKYDKFDPRSSHLVPAIIAKVHAAKAANSDVEIWGDGTARREFLYAEDAAACIWHAAENFEDMPDIMNLGVGTDHSVHDYYQAAARVIGWDGNFVFDTERPVGMKRKLVDVSHQKALGFPAISGLEVGLKRTYDYYLKEVLV